MKIVCGIDLTESSAVVGGFAARLAGYLRDQVVLVHAVTDVAAPADVTASAKAVERALHEKARRELEALAAKLRGPDLQVGTRVVEGNVPEVLIAAARETAARLIVVGVRPHTHLPWSLGNSAERTLHDADRPVLVVHERPPRFEEWEGRRRRLRLAVSVDYSEASDRLIAWVRELRRDVPCDVAWIHIYWPPGEMSRLGLSGPMDLVAPAAEVQSAVERDLARRVGELPGEGDQRILARPSWGRTADALALRAEEEGVDLIVVGTHGRRGLDLLREGSFAVQELHRTKLPVLAIPPDAARAALAPEELPIFRHVLVATDLSENGNRALALAYGVVRGTGGTVEVFHVLEKGASEDEARRELLGLVPEAAAALGIATHFTVVKDAEPAAAILQAAERLGVHAIVVGSHGRSGLERMLVGSVAEKVLRGAGRPVLIAPRRR